MFPDHNYYLIYIYLLTICNISYQCHLISVYVCNIQLNIKYTSDIHFSPTLIYIIVKLSNRSLLLNLN